MTKNPIGLCRDDKTPSDWLFRSAGAIETLKRPLRQLIYPSYLRIIGPRLQRKFDPHNELAVNQWFWGYRGFDARSLRRLANWNGRVQSSSILLVGCGTGSGIDNWMEHPPVKLLGIDLFNYSRAWRQLEQRYEPILKFQQADASAMPEIPSGSFDVVASDAVLEHVKDLEKVVDEMRRVLRMGGTLWATYGPLWHSFGGDHVSGSDDLANGYNYLLLPPEEYERYLMSMGDFVHNESDGRTWWRNGLFSYLRLDDYTKVITEAGFDRCYCALVIDPRAVIWLKKNSQKGEYLLRKVSMLDLVCSAVCTIAVKI
jgi:ubiquinone/menaquinone biosynthesis C-methylase UbiE